jgi:hypothetical protein
LFWGVLNAQMRVGGLSLDRVVLKVKLNDQSSAFDAVIPEAWTTFERITIYFSGAIVMNDDRESLPSPLATRIAFALNT